MSSLKRRMLFGLFSLALLSVCFWTGYEFLNLARMKKDKKAAHDFCSAVKIGMPTVDAVALANSNRHKRQITVAADEMLVHFGQKCDCRISFSDKKQVAKRLAAAAEAAEDRSMQTIIGKVAMQ